MLRDIFDNYKYTFMLGLYIEIKFFIFEATVSLMNMYSSQWTQSANKWGIQQRGGSQMGNMSDCASALEESVNTELEQIRLSSSKRDRDYTYMNKHITID